MKQKLLIFSLLIILSACNSRIVATPSLGDTQTSQQTITPYIPVSLPTNSQTGDVTLVNGCIPPIESFAYPVEPDEKKIIEVGNLNILPSLPWQIEDVISKSAAPKGILGIAATRFINGHSEIWVEIHYLGGLDLKSDPEFYKFLIYRTDTKIWRTISAEIQNTGVFIDQLYIAKDGSVWGHNVWNQYSHISDQSILSRYNEVTESFEFERGVQTIPATWKASDGFLFWSKVLLDFDGIFWIFVHKDTIYSYNPVTQEIKRHIKIPGIVVSGVALSPDKNIYFLRLQEDDIVTTIHDEDLFRFSPKTEKLENLPISLEPWPLFSNILVDHAGRLWLDNLGWREPNGIWYQIQRSPVFTTNVISSGSDHRWKTPQILFESSDGRLWFLSDNGMVSLDPQKGEWCWFTTYKSNIVEDAEHNLWMIADGKLYKYPLNS